MSKNKKIVQLNAKTTELQEKLVKVNLTSPVASMPLDAMQAELDKLYQEFLPTITGYQRVAARVLELQVGIFKGRLQAQLGVSPVEFNLVASITARDQVKALDQLLATLDKEKIAISKIVYDPRTFSFHLFSTTPKANE